MDEGLESPILAEQDITDEMRIQFVLDELYENLKSFDGYDDDKIRRIKLLRNNVINMMDTYLKKFDNKKIMSDFYSRLIGAKLTAINNGKINKYTQYMNEIRVVQEFKGIKENIAQKLGEQLFENICNSEEVIPYGDEQDDTIG